MSVESKGKRLGQSSCIYEDAGGGSCHIKEPTSNPQLPSFTLIYMGNGNGNGNGDGNGRGRERACEKSKWGERAA